MTLDSSALWWIQSGVVGIHFLPLLLCRFFWCSDLCTSATTHTGYSAPSSTCALYALQFSACHTISCFQASCSTSWDIATVHLGLHSACQDRGRKMHRGTDDLLFQTFRFSVLIFWHLLIKDSSPWEHFDTWLNFWKIYFFPATVLPRPNESFWYLWTPSCALLPMWYRMLNHTFFCNV